MELTRRALLSERVRPRALVSSKAGFHTTDLQLALAHEDVRAPTEELEW